MRACGQDSWRSDHQFSRRYFLVPSHPVQVFADHSGQEGIVTEHSSVALLHTSRDSLVWETILPVVGGHRTS